MFRSRTDIDFGRLFAAVAIFAGLVLLATAMKEHAATRLHTASSPFHAVGQKVGEPKPPPRLPGGERGGQAPAPDAIVRALDELALPVAPPPRPAGEDR